GTRLTLSDWARSASVMRSPASLSPRAIAMIRRSSTSSAVVLARRIGDSAGAGPRVSRPIELAILLRLLSYARGLGRGNGRELPPAECGYRRVADRQRQL